jgi:hypothetical protein
MIARRAKWPCGLRLGLPDDDAVRALRRAAAQVALIKEPTLRVASYDYTIRSAKQTLDVSGIQLELLTVKRFWQEGR